MSSTNVVGSLPLGGVDRTKLMLEEQEDTEDGGDDEALPSDPSGDIIDSGSVPNPSGSCWNKLPSDISDDTLDLLGASVSCTQWHRLKYSSELV